MRNAEGVDVGGGTNEFLELIGNGVRDVVKQELWKRQVEIGKEALFGHSFGGLCVLHALFTQAIRMDVFFACSPSIWWNDSWVLQEEENFRNSSFVLNDYPKPVLVLSYGSLEEETGKK
jgi:predicted alpha/beta superfamily hydrolase